MKLSLVVAADEAGGIGIQGRLPWKLSTDLRRFRALTTGHHILMGRRTWESIARPLPERVNIIVSANLETAPPGCLLAPTLSAGLLLARRSGENEAFVIGGAQLYAVALPLTDNIHLTRVHTRVPADVFFPPFDPAEWQVVEEIFIPAGDKDQYPSTYFHYQRKAA